MQFSRFLLGFLACATLAMGCDDSDTKTPSEPGTTPGTNPGTNPGQTSAETVTNETCDNKTPETCDNEVARFCGEDGKIHLRDCKKLKTEANPVTCHVSEDNFADCVLPCKSSEFTEYNSCLDNYVATHMCEKVQGGGTYEFVYTDEACPKACDGGRCVDEAGPVPGSQCSESKCFGTTRYICNGGKYEAQPCTGDTECAMRHGDAIPQCVAKCKSSDTANDVYRCIESSGHPAIDNSVCQLATDGHYYRFEEKRACNTSCTDGVCDITIPTVGDTCDPDAYYNVCLHDTLYYCDYQKKKYAVEKCANTMWPVCRVDTEGVSGCVAPCTEGSESFPGCVGKVDRENAYTDNRVCSKGSDGSYYYFTESVYCPNGCDSKTGTCL